MRLVVVGAGVVGLTCALRLREAGHEVSVWARELPPHTTSDVAAAVWLPYLAEPRVRVTAWARISLVRFLELAETEPGSGVLVRDALEVHLRPHIDDAGALPAWCEGVPHFRRAREDALPQSVRRAGGFGWAFRAPVVQMPQYLPWLLARLRAAGVDVVQRELRSLDDAFAAGGVGVEGVVNCTGLGARELVPDPRLFPIRGEVVKVGPLAEPRVVLDDAPDAPPTYVIPRAHDTVLGGTALPRDGSLTTDEAAVRSIRARCAALVPETAALPELGRAVGLRPGRDEVRLEREQTARGPVVHCYGHGGAGVTLSWGCADEVVSLLATEG